MKSITFSYNWNKKLDCDSFTTIRLSNYYSVDEIILIKCKNNVTDTGKIIQKIATRIDKLTELVCRLDTGYSRDITINLIKKMYPGITDWNNQIVYIYLIDRKYYGKDVKLVDALHDDGIINKNDLEYKDQFLMDYLECKV